MEKIRIQGLEVYAYHGSSEHERELGHRYSLDCEIMMTVHRTEEDGRLVPNLNYVDLAEFLVASFQEDTYEHFETACEETIFKVLDTFSEVRSVKLRVTKAAAHIPFPVDGITVEMERARHHAIIALGGNIGNRNEYLLGALHGLEHNPRIEITKTSSLYETKPWGMTDQADFLNQVIEVSTTLSAEDLLHYMLHLEHKLGRVRDIKWGPRTIDLDLIYYDDLVMRSDDLILPHPLMHEREFVLEPLMEIAPHYLHPVKNLSTRELLQLLREKQKNEKEEK